MEPVEEVSAGALGQLAIEALPAHHLADALGQSYPRNPRAILDDPLDPRAPPAIEGDAVVANGLAAGA
ncbi:MAG: hypothetical protein ACYDA8_06290 [Deferrisomatales bacterium]